MKATALMQHQSSITHVNATAGKVTDNPLQLKTKDNDKLAWQKIQNPLTTSTPYQNPLQLKENKTGLPDHVKAGMEALSGYSMDDVQVHYNSDKPAQLQALAYTKGTEIHVAPGQEKHIPHEAWHVVQQKQGRVKATMQMKGGVNISDDAGLEKEADTMGAKALTAHTQVPVVSVQSIKTRDVIQQKGRIDLEKITATGEDAEIVAKKKLELKKELEKLKEEKRKQKTETTAKWIKNPDGTQDEAYNTDIARIRKEYEEKVKTLAEKELGKGHAAYISGDDYYGKQVDTSNLYKRSDNNKEYVKDMRGTFVPRYVRRELNQNDVPKVNNSEDLVPTGISTYKGLLKGRKKIHDLEGMSDAEKDDPISWAHREFLQQSGGGGGNQFAFSHTSTKRPILSNAHNSFGTFDNGAILSDLSQIPKENIAAQWSIDPNTGHKVALGEGEHAELGTKSKFEERDKTVRTSGYRNMEILTASIPHTAIVEKPGDASGWKGPDIKQAEAVAYNERLNELKLRNEEKAQLTKQIKQIKNQDPQKAALKQELDKKEEEIKKLEEELKNTSYGLGTSARGALMEQKRRELEKKAITKK